jgi:hypothetical protein
MKKFWEFIKEEYLLDFSEYVAIGAIIIVVGVSQLVLAYLK